ncbi:MAG TPA: tetratricopeptide repeat protein, partial [Candidatus Sulfotelmatobacter sp.]|nr:tetratricopeptide repeat protein [Candidatus Sulfotelmatobacter sp.]
MAISKLIPALLLAWTAVSAAAQARPGARPHTPTPTAEERAADDLKAAEDLLQKKQYQLAEEKLATIVEEQKTNPQAWFDLGFAESHLGKAPESVKAYQKAVELSPKWFEAQNNLGLALTRTGDLAGAATILRIAVTLKPTTGGQQALAEAWLSLADVTQDSQPQESLAAYQKAAELDPLNSRALFGSARLAENSENFSMAEQQYLKLAEKDDTGAIERLIDFYVRQKRYADAEAWLHKYSSANPEKSYMAQIMLGRLLIAQAKTQEAIATLEPLYQSNHDSRLALDLAHLYMEVKQYDSAARLLQPLAANPNGAGNPNDGQLHFDYGSALLHLHKYPEAQAELLKALQLKPSLTDAYFDLAYAAQQNKNYELTIRVLDA